MKKYFFACLILINFFRIFAMEIDQKNDWQKSFDSIWMLHLLPEPIQDEISTLCQTPSYQPIDSFEQGAKDENGKSIYVTEKEYLEISFRGSLKKKAGFFQEVLIESQEVLLESIYPSCSTIDYVSAFALSPNKKIVIALVDNCKLVIFDIHNPKCQKVLRLADKTWTKDEIKNKPTRVGVVFKEFIKNEQGLVSNGDRTDWSHPKKLAISNDGRIAFATGKEVFLTDVIEDQNQKVIFYRLVDQRSEHLKNGTQEIFDRILFNNQGTLLGIFYNNFYRKLTFMHEASKAIRLKEEPKRTMCQFMKERGVCRNWKAQVQEAKANRDGFIATCLEAKPTWCLIL